MKTTRHKYSNLLAAGTVVALAIAAASVLSLATTSGAQHERRGIFFGHEFHIEQGLDCYSCHDMEEGGEIMPSHDLCSLCHEIEPSEEGPPDAHVEVFKALLQGSETASKLVKGQIGTLNFSEWSIIQETTSETWVDLVATWTSGQEVHFFWSVNPINGVVRPLNQAARNLESSVGSP